MTPHMLKARAIHTRAHDVLILTWLTLPNEDEEWDLVQEAARAIQAGDPDGDDYDLPPGPDITLAHGTWLRSFWCPLQTPMLPIYFVLPAQDFQLAHDWLVEGLGYTEVFFRLLPANPTRWAPRRHREAVAWQFVRQRYFDPAGDTSA